MAGHELRTIETNGIRVRIAEQGEGPLVLLLHGFPESWYSWRHQLPALAEAGFHAVAPDLRGYGGSDAPPEIEDYNILQLTADATGILDALGEETAVVVGHDWGAMVAWQCALLHADRFRAVAALSVPYGGRSARPPLEQTKEAFGDNFFYQLYFQEPGVAEGEFDADPRRMLSRVYTSVDGEVVGPPEITSPLASAGGWIGRMPEQKQLPDWLTTEDLDYFVGEFERAGFRGGVNFYRNIDRNWELTPQLAGALVEQPALFVAGEQDLVLSFGGRSSDDLEERLRAVIPKLTKCVLIPDTGHWTQQERPAEVNAALIEFLRGLD